MTDKRTKDAIRECRQLNNAGYNVGKRRTIRLHTNPQDETPKHAHAKMAVGKVLAETGYRVDSEVEHEPTGNVADVLGYGCDGRRPCVVELETDWSRETKLKNIRKYNHGPIAEVWTLDVTDLPNEVADLHQRVKGELGL